MQALLKTMLESSVLICVIALLRCALLQKMPKRTFLLLWKIALFRLLIPLSIPAPSSIYNLLQHAQETVPQAQPAQLPATILHLTETQTAAPVLTRSLSPLLLLWAAGACISAGYFLHVHFRFKKLCADSLPLDTPFIRQWQQTHPLRRKVRIRQSDRISTPLTYGAFRPTILLPKATPGSPEQLTFILLHEYTHIRRFDILLKILLTAARCIYWFNPAVHLMACLAGRDIELTCDEAVLQACGRQSRSAYALTLLEQEEARIASPSCTCFSQNTAKERITVIMKMKKMTVVTSVLAIALITGTVTVFATSRSASDTPQSQADIVSIVMADEDTRKEPTFSQSESLADMSGGLSEEPDFAQPSAPSEPAELPADIHAEQTEAAAEITDTESYVPSESPADIPAEMSEIESDIPSKAPADVPSEDTEIAVQTGSGAEEAYKSPADIPLFIWPLADHAGTISVPYGEKGHNGIDIAATSGTAILAAADGIVLEAGYDIREGNYVLIQHGGCETLYSHCESVAVQAGDAVFQGDRIGTVGKTGMATGDHLHFELRMNGQTADPYTCIQDR